MTDVSDLKDLPATERVAEMRRRREALKADDPPIARTNTSPRPPAGDIPLVDAAEAAQAEGKARKRPTAKTIPSTDGQRYKPGMFVDPLTGMYTAIGLGISAFDKHKEELPDGTVVNVPKCGMAIVENAEHVATQWDALAEKNPAVRRALLKLMQGGAWAGVISAHLPIVGAIFANHFPALMPNIHMGEANAG